MYKIKFWDGKSGVQTPLKNYGVEEFTKEYGNTKIVLSYLDDVVVGSINSLAVLKNNYKIDPNLSDEEALKAIEEIMNAPQPEPTAEEVAATTPATREELRALGQLEIDNQLLMYEILAKLEDK